MAFNFNTYNNPLELITKFNQFKQFINNSGKSPEVLFKEEMEKRNITGDQLKELMQGASALKIFFNHRSL